MSNRIKISVLSEFGIDKLKFNPNDYASNLNTMINYLNSELQNVLPNNPDLIVFPESCDRFTGITDDEQNLWYSFRLDKIRDYLQDVAKKNNCMIAYSATRKANDNAEYPFSNSTQLISRSGEIDWIYDKVHLVPFEMDGRKVSYGEGPKLVSINNTPVAAAICFDLNYEDLIQFYSVNQPKLTLFSSFFHGGLLQTQWAYRCRSYVAASVCMNQSRIIDPFGQTIASSTNYHDFATAQINLDYALVHIDRNEEKIISAKKKYGSSLTVTDPGNVGSVMLTCEDDDKNVEQIIREFDILPLDDYFRICIEHRNKALNK